MHATWSIKTVRGMLQSCKLRSRISGFSQGKQANFNTDFRSTFIKGHTNITWVAQSCQRPYSTYNTDGTTKATNLPHFVHVSNRHVLFAQLQQLHTAVHSTALNCTQLTGQKNAPPLRD